MPLRLRISSRLATRRASVALAFRSLIAMSATKREERSTEAGVDFSVAAIKEAYIALRNASMIDFTYGTPPVLHKKSQVFTDDRGRIVRDLRTERAEKAAREAGEAAAPRKTFEGELKKAETRAQVNRTIEETRAQIASFRGPSHSKTYQVREAAQKILDAAIQNDRTLGGIATAASDIKLLFNKAWD